jgi:hypothetical protein
MVIQQDTVLVLGGVVGENREKRPWEVSWEVDGLDVQDRHVAADVDMANRHTSARPGAVLEDASPVRGMVPSVVPADEVESVTVVDDSLDQAGQRTVLEHAEPSAKQMSHWTEEQSRQVGGLSGWEPTDTPTAPALPPELVVLRAWQDILGTAR